MSALYSRSTCLILVCFLVGSLNSKHVRTDSTDTFCHFDVEWLLFFLSNLLFILFFLCLSLIPPCNLMTWIKKINFRAVSDLSCECVPLVRLRHGKKTVSGDALFQQTRNISGEYFWIISESNTLNTSTNTLFF